MDVIPLKEQEKVIHNSNKTKKTKKSKRRYGFLFGLFLLAYLPSVFHWLSGGNVSIDRIRMGTVEESFNAKAVIIRDCITYEAEFNGICIPGIEDGEKVPSGYRIASVYRESAVEYMAELRAKEKQIMEAIRNKMENSRLYDTDINKVENEIKDWVFNLARETKNNTMEAVNAIEKKINELTLKKAAMLGDTGTTDVYINQLNNEKANLEQKIDLNRVEIIPDCTGLVSYFIDGYEDLLGVERLGEITSEVINSVKYIPYEIRGDYGVTAGKSFVKLIKGVDYYLAISTENDKAATLYPGDSTRVRFNDIGKETSADVVSRTREENGKIVLVLKIDRYMTDTLSMRLLNVDIILNSYEGLLVYEKALIDPDYGKKTAGLMLAMGNFASYRKVRILGGNGGMVVITKDEESKGDINLYDSYILNPKNITDGQVIRN
jgi:putative membrane fusion protein